MITVQDVLSNLFSVSMITELSNWLVEKDLDFPPVQAAYQDAAKILVNQLGKEAEAFLSAQDQQIISDLRYSAYLGFQANLANFRYPGGNHFVSQGSDRFLHEQSMGSPQNFSWMLFKIITSIWKQSVQSLPITGDMFLPISFYPWWNRDMSAMVHKPAFIQWN